MFRNEAELAEEMLERAFSAGVPARWVVADSFYGRLHSCREWLEERGRPYVVMVPKTNAVALGGRKKKIEQHAERLPKEAFSEVCPARDAGGRRPWEWACMDLAADPEKGMRSWLLVRRGTDDPEIGRELVRRYAGAYGDLVLEHLEGGDVWDRLSISHLFPSRPG